MDEQGTTVLAFFWRGILTEGGWQQQNASHPNQTTQANQAANPPGARWTGCAAA